LVTDVFFNLKTTEGALWPAERIPGVADSDSGPKTWKEAFDGYCSKVNANTGAQDSVLKVLNYETPSSDGEYVCSLSSREFDAVGDILPFRNGVLELETGEFRKTRKEDKITTYLPWDYEPSTDATHFLEFLERAQPDPEVRDYLQRRAGYALSASTSEKKFWIDQGIADAGKSTYDLILSEILGPFAYSADKNLFYASGEENPEKKGNLFRKRMILLDEWDSKQKINSSLIKGIAAGGPDNGRFLYGDPFGFNHTGKVFITTNANVKMDLDSGLITRLVVIPWNKPITPDQKQKQQALTGGVDFFRWVVSRERMGIINWMAEGYRMWRERPLSMDVPEAIQENTRAYLDNNPVNAYFFDNWVRTSDPKDKVKCSDFHRMFLESYDGDDRTEWTMSKVTQTLKGLQVEWKKSINFGVNPETGKKEVTSGFTGIKPKEGQ
jgi:putative DNA primase/helicase